MNIKKRLSGINVARPISSLKKRVNTKKVKVLVVVILLLALGYFTRSLFFAAFVNGRPITRISLIKALEAQGGQSILDNLIEKELILQEGRRESISVGKEVIDSEISRIEELLKGQGLSLEEALQARGETMASLNEQIKIQKVVEAILSPKIAITDEEVNKYFEDNKDLFGSDAKLEDVTSDIKDQLFQEKLSQEYSKWISDLRSKAKVTYFLKF